VGGEMRGSGEGYKENNSVRMKVQECDERL
jgi:hypothetical protein